MSRHSCNLPHCDGTRLGHELARDFPQETARLDEALDQIAHPEDHVMPENLQVHRTVIHKNIHCDWIAEARECPLDEHLIEVDDDTPPSDDI